MSAIKRFFHIDKEYIGRLEYFIATLKAVIVTVVLGIIIGTVIAVMTGLLPPTPGQPLDSISLRGLGRVGYYTALVIMLPLFFAIGKRRLRDMGLSGVWFVLPGLIVVPIIKFVMIASLSLIKGKGLSEGTKI